MDESDYSGSSDETSNDSNGGNESDNKLVQYMLINKELSKTMVVLKAENAKLRNTNKVLNMENLTFRNELTSNRSEIMKWQRKFTKLQTMHIQHVEMLTTELQSYADKLSGVFGHDDEDDEDAETEVTSQATEQHSTVANSSSIGDDVDDASPRVSKTSLHSSNKPDIKLPDMLDENTSSLNTIHEESEECIKTSSSEEISLVLSSSESTLIDEAFTHASTLNDETTATTTASTHASTLNDETTATTTASTHASTLNDETTVTTTASTHASTLNDETTATTTAFTHASTLNDETTTITTVVDLDGTETIIFRKSVSDSCEMASMDSNKENERPSTFVSSKLALTNDDSSMTGFRGFELSINGNDGNTPKYEIRTNDTATKSTITRNELIPKTELNPFKEKYVTVRRTRKRTFEQNSFERTISSELVSSTPYKRKKSATHSEIVFQTTTPVKSNDSTQITRRTTSTSGRPKRNLCPVNFVEPKLNTKLRRAK